MTTAAERLVALSGRGTTTAAAHLLAIGIGLTAGAALVNYSGLTSGTATEHLLTERVREASGGFFFGKTKYRTREEIDAERRKLGILPPSVEVSAAKSARKAIAERASEEKALRDAVEALRAEVGRQEAARLRALYIAVVRLEMERELLRQRQEEEEVIAILAIQLLAA